MAVEIPSPVGSRAKIYRHAILIGRGGVDNCPALDTCGGSGECALHRCFYRASLLGQRPRLAQAAERERNVVTRPVCFAVHVPEREITFVWVLCLDSSRLHPALQLFLRPGILLSSFPLNSFPWIRRQDSPPRAGDVLEPRFILRAEPASHFHTRRRASAGLWPRGRARDLPRSPAPRAFSAQQERRTRAIDDPACPRTKDALGHMRQPHSSHCAVTS